MLRAWWVAPSARERSRTIRNDLPSPLAATGMLSLGLLAPVRRRFGHRPDRQDRSPRSRRRPPPSTSRSSTTDSPQTLETRAATADDLLAENGIVRAPEDALSVDPASPLVDGETVVYRAAVPVTVVVDDQPRTLRTAAADRRRPARPAGRRLGPPRRASRPRPRPRSRTTPS